jgi:predicted O-methyltransferase YrrM
MNLEQIVTGMRAADNTAYTLEVISKLTRDPLWTDVIIKMIKDDILETRRALCYLCPLLQPGRYLEIGVRRGLSMAMVASCMPECSITGMDLWMENYGGVPNPGPDFVREELKRVGYRGQLDFISGSTQVTLPQFVSTHPEPFDLIMVDGDHTYEGARNDLWHSLKLLHPEGGMLLFDDIHIAEARQAWNECKAEFPQHAYLDLQKFGLLLS